MKSTKYTFAPDDVKEALNEWLAKKPSTFRVVDAPELELNICDTGRVMMAASTKWQKPHEKNSMNYMLEGVYLAKIRNEVYALTGHEIYNKHGQVDAIICIDPLTTNKKIEVTGPVFYKQFVTKHYHPRAYFCVRYRDGENWYSAKASEIDWDLVTNVMVVRGPANGWVPAGEEMPHGEFVVILNDTGYKLINLLETSPRQWRALSPEWYKTIEF